MTRPLGASLGDFLSQVQSNGGLGLGATLTSFIFLSAILITVVFLTITKSDMITKASITEPIKTKPKVVFLQVGVTIAVLLIASVSGYTLRHGNIQNETASSNSQSAVWDLASFRKIAEDTLNLVQASDLPAAKSRVTDLESAWDKAETRLKPISSANWTKADKAIDDVLRKLRSINPNASACQSSLEALISLFDSPDMK